MAACLAAGCNVSLFHDAITTSVEIPGAEVGLFTTSKMFRFERDFAAARKAVMHRAWVSIDMDAPDMPEGIDLSVFSSIDVYVLEPETGTRKLAVQGSGFRPGQTQRVLDIMLYDDLKRYITEGRISLDWEIMRNAMVPAWDPEATIRVRFGLVLEIETN